LNSEALQGKRALVTGAGSRLGQAIAIGLGSSGMHVGVHYHNNLEGARETARQIEVASGRAHVIAADLSSRLQARQLVDSATEALGGLDLLVLSAGTFENVSYAAIDDDTWDRTLDLNLAAPFAMAHRATDTLKRSHGNIVFITCSSVIRPFRGYLPYVVAKAGVHQLMRALAMQLAPLVRVNAVAPGMVLPPVDMGPQQIERLAEQSLLRSVGNPDDVVRAVIYLASSPFVTGEQLVVDGGRWLARPC
jgi:pteridine reductase